MNNSGQAFREDSSKTGTYENGHISNFRVPLVFYHPQLPNIQVNANASAMSTIPTLLDLMVQTQSLNKVDTDVALDLMNEYEGQSLIRPFKTNQNGRRVWHFGVINTGGTILSVGDASVPFRLIIPLQEDKEYIFTDFTHDPFEQKMTRDFSITSLSRRLRRTVSTEASMWVLDADKVSKWWMAERKRLYNYGENDDDSEEWDNSWANWS